MNVCCIFHPKAYDNFGHNHTVNHPENAKILQNWKAVLDSYNTKPGREKALIITADDDLSTARIYLDAGVTIVRISPLSRNGTSLAERIEAQLKDFNFGRIGWMVSSYYVVFFFNQRLKCIDTHQL